MIDRYTNKYRERLNKELTEEDVEAPALLERRGLQLDAGNGLTD